MRVMYVIDSLGAGGAERSLAEMLAPLEERGVQTLVVCLEHRREGFHDEVAASHDVRVLPEESDARRVVPLRRLIGQWRPDIVHSTLIRADLVARFATARTDALHLTSLVNTTYDPERLLDPHVNRRGLEAVRRLDGFTARHLTQHFHAITHAVAESNVRALGIDPERITVIPRGRDERRLGEPSPARKAAARASLGIPQEAEVIVHVGRHEGQKAIPDLVRAVAVLVYRGRPALLLQVGREGNDTRKIQATIAAEGMRGSVLLMGHREDVPEMLAASDVFAFPSLYEGLGGSVIEAMALGLPIVASRIPALTEILEEGSNSKMADVGDWRDLADRLDELLSDSPARALWGLHSRRAFLTSYTLDRAVTRMIEMYVAIGGLEVRERPGG